MTQLTLDRRVRSGAAWLPAPAETPLAAAVGSQVGQAYIRALDRLSGVSRFTPLSGAAAERELPLEEKLFDARAFCKMETRKFSMYFDADWQSCFFRQLDALMDAEEWDAADEPVKADAFKTMIRLLLILRGKKPPSLGISAGGHILASWFASRHDILTVECMPGDRVRWIVTMPLDEEPPEIAAGTTMLSLLMARLAPYNPDHWL